MELTGFMLNKFKTIFNFFFLTYYLKARTKSQITRFYHCEYYVIRGYKQKDNMITEVDEYFKDKLISSVKTCTLSFKDYYSGLIKDIDTITKKNKRKEGIMVSTFHSLKGLENKRVFITGLDNNVFPALQTLPEEATAQYRQKYLEGERRLFYVTITRGRDKLYLYYNLNNPTIFVEDLMLNKSKWSINDIKLTNAENCSLIEIDPSESEELDYELLNTMLKNTTPEQNSRIKRFNI